MVVRLDAGKDTVRAYVEEQASQGLEHVRALVGADTQRMIALIQDLGQEEGTTPPEPGEWSVAQVLEHLNSSLDRSRARLQALSSGQEWVNPPVTPGQVNESGKRGFGELRTRYIEGMAAIQAVLDGAGETRGLELTADHAELGPFNWLQWAVYSHHVHTHDHIGQTEEAKAKARKEA